MSKDKAREFWIEFLEDDDHIIWHQPVNEETIHVIEYYAYAALEAKLAECVALIERLARYEAAGRGQAGLQSMIVQARECLAKVKK